MQLPNLSARMLRRKSEFSPTTCRCPINSFITCARIRSAKGAAPVFNVSKKEFCIFLLYHKKGGVCKNLLKTKKAAGIFTPAPFASQSVSRVLY